MHAEIKQTFNEKLLVIHPNDPTFEARRYMTNKKKDNKKDKLFAIDQKIENSIKSKTTKMLIDSYA